MTDTPAGLPSAPPPGGQVSDRMQALLSRAVEEQVSEQRAVSTVLTELRNQVAALSDGVRLTASDASVERLGGVVSGVVADLRTSTSLLGQRIEALSKRIEAVATDTAAPTEQAAVRLAALSADIAAQADTVEQMRAALEQLAAFPGALASMQKDVAGLHDRLQPLAEVRATVGDLSARTATSLTALGPQIDALQTKVEAIGVVPDPERLRDAVVDALNPRLVKLEEAAARPTVGPEALRSGLGDTRVAITAAVAEKLDDVTGALGAVENRLGQVGERLAEVGDAAGGVPAIATDLARLSARVEELLDLRQQLAGVAEGVKSLQDDNTGTALALGLTALRDDLEHLGERLTETAPPPIEEVAALVSQRVADRLVETLAPRIADVVLTRVSAALVLQLGEALSPRVKADTELVVRTATAESERRILVHLDEAVLALAEALLRRRRGGRAATTAVVLPTAAEPIESATPAMPGASVVEPVAEAEPVVAGPVAAEPVAAEPVDTEPVDTEPVDTEPVDTEPVDTEPVVEGGTHAEVAPVQDIVDAINAAGEPKRVAPQPVAEAEAVTVVQGPGSGTMFGAARPAVTTGLAPARAQARSAPAVGRPAAQEPAVQEPAAQGPAAQEPAAQEPAVQAPTSLSDAATQAGPGPAELLAELAAEDTGAQDALADEVLSTEARTEAVSDVAKGPAKRPAKVTVEGPDALTPAPRTKPRANGTPPVKRAIRPPAKAPTRPILDRTPDLSEDDIEPIRSGPVRPPAQQPPASQSAPAQRSAQQARPAQPPAASTPAQATPARPATPAQQGSAPQQGGSAPQAPQAPQAAPLAKRKPWWRPGG